MSDPSQDLPGDDSLEAARAAKAEKARRAKQRAKWARGVTAALFVLALIAAIRLLIVEPELSELPSRQRATADDQRSSDVATAPGQRGTGKSPTNTAPGAGTPPSLESAAPTTDDEESSKSPTNAAPSSSAELSPRSPFRTFATPEEEFGEKGEKEQSPAEDTSALRPPTFEEIDDAMRRRAAYLYKQQCAVCHGTEGKGDGPFAPRFGPLTDLSDPGYWKIVGMDRVERLIRFGSDRTRLGPKMPGFDAMFADDADFQAFLNYVQSLAVEEEKK